MSLLVEQLRFRAGGRDILKGLDASLIEGKITAIVGPNGSGKSTLLKALAGEHSASAGQVSLAGKALQQWPKRQLARQLAMLPQSSPRPLGMTVYELVSCGRFPHTGTWRPFSDADHQAVLTALAKTDLQRLQDSRVDHLSGGEMQRVRLALVLAQQTPLLLLDEPTSYLDINHQLQLLAIVRELNREQGVTVAWVLHDLNQALQFSDQIWVMNDGQLQRQGAAAQVLDAELLREVFAVEATFVHTPSLPSPVMVPLGQAVSEQPLLEQAG